MEANTTYEEVFKKMADVIVSKNVRTSLNNLGDNFMVTLSYGEGDAYDTIYIGYFNKKDSDIALNAKCEGFLAMVNYISSSK